MQKAAEYINGNELVAVGASEKPRNVSGSYMPCFLTGIAARESIASATGAVSYGFSHQCGHIMAVLFESGNGKLLSEQFVAFHISGGTTEMLSVKGNGTSFDAQLIGGSADLKAGQVIDRIGVYMGLSFPAGAQMEALALLNKKRLPSKKPKINGLEFNLSGLENMAQSLYDQTQNKELTAAFVFDYIGSALVAVCDNYVKLYGDTKFLFAGGVMSNSIIKNMLSERFDAIFASPSVSADNAVGIAALTLNLYNSEN
jgi:N6-L-threonylcarbamoyladenine synthase